MNNKLGAVTAANRFGLGARPGELRQVGAYPRSWLKAQLNSDYAPPAEITGLDSSKKVLSDAFAYQHARRSLNQRAEKDPGFDLEKARRDLGSPRDVTAPFYLAQVAARYRLAINTNDPFRERLVHFWSNHFAVSADKRWVVGVAGAMENEAIRPNLRKNFSDMLLAVEQHPAMILYLDNQGSTGPNSPAARRRRGAGRKLDINENLAREILELHTLGVAGGYTQQDVTRFAHAISGWSVGRGSRFGGEIGVFQFQRAMHEPGTARILGKDYRDNGVRQGEAVLRDLAKHPATAEFVATKLARHFIADEPPERAVQRIAKAFRTSAGHLPTVHEALIDCPEAWTGERTKFKTPHDFVVSTFRALEITPRRPRQLLAPFEMLGQRPFTPGSPAGWPDRSANWDGADALLKRIEWSVAMAERAGGRHRQPLAVAEAALGESLGDHTRVAVARAESPSQGLALMLASPEFQRR